MILDHSIVSTPLYIGGRWSEGHGEPIPVLDPSTEHVLYDVPSASADDVEVALRAAATAQHSWAARPAMNRGSYVREIAELVHKHREQLASLLVSEVGKPRSQALAELQFAEDLLRYNAEWDRRLEGDVLPGEVADESILLLRVPVGVVAAICPWNFPLAVLCRKLAPALITGNTVIVKPSEVSPLTSIALFRLIDENLDLPPGVLGLVPGGAETGRALVASPITSLVSFTGHRDTGKEIMRAAANNLSRISLELGGKAPAIVWKDADVDLAVDAILTARHTNAGQVCTAAESVLVHTDVLEQFTERYVSAANALRIGDPVGDVDLGPLVSSAQWNKTSAAVARAIDDGAELLAGGGRPAGGEFVSGYWHAPTVLRVTQPETEILNEEVFGPVTPIIGISSLDQALTISNQSRYGLSAYVFSNDYSTIMRAISRLDFGEIFVNRTLGESVHAHHAGFKESGVGGEDGKWGLLRYTQVKTVYHRYGQADTGAG